MTVKEEQVIKKRNAQHALQEIYQSEKKYVDKLTSIVEVSFDKKNRLKKYQKIYKNYYLIFWN